MSTNIVLEKSYRFALRIVQLYKYLCDEKKEFVMSKYLLAAGADVGARVKAAQEAESKDNFIREMSIALQQTSRTEYWLQLLSDSGYINKQEFASIHADCVELLKLLTSIVKKSKGIR